MRLDPLLVDGDYDNAAAQDDAECKLVARSVGAGRCPVGPLVGQALSDQCRVSQRMSNIRDLHASLLHSTLGVLGEDKQSRPRNAPNLRQRI